MAGIDKRGRGAQTDLLEQENWALGMNTASPPEELRDDEAQDLENLVFDDQDNLKLRVGVQDWLGENLSTRITSIHRYVDNTGTVRIIYTTGNIIKRADENGGNITDITGGLTLPSDTYWQWRTFNGVAIGVNGGTGANANPVVVSGASNAVALGGSPPKAKFIEIWNDRVWLDDRDNVNRVRGSAVGNQADWTTAGVAGTVTLDIDRGDGDRINGLVQFRESLFVLKRKKINFLSTVGTPVTSTANIRQDIYTLNIGCESGYSVQPVLDDVLFDSGSGVASLAQSEFGELKTALLSSKISELATIRKNTDQLPSLVLDDVNQYWLSIPASANPKGIAEMWVLHYDKINQQIKRFTRFTGRVCGTAFAEKLNGDFKEYLIAFHDIGGSGSTIYKYSPTTTSPVFNDDGGTYSWTLKTKAYSLLKLIQKKWVRWGLGLRLLTTNLSLPVRYFFNNTDIGGGSYSFNLTIPPTGGIWNVSLWNNANWGGNEFRDEFIWRRFKKIARGSRGVNVTFVISNTTKDQAFIFKYFAIEYRLLSHRRVTTV